MKYKYQGQKTNYLNGVRKWFPNKSLPAVLTEEILLSLGITAEEETIPELTLEQQTHNKIHELENYLRNTDWYAIRKADTGEAIPAEITTARQTAREQISTLRGE